MNKKIRIRTVGQAAAYFRENDKETVISEYMLRRLVKEGNIPYKKTGSKILLNLDQLIEYFSFEEIEKVEEAEEEKETERIRGIRRVME